LQPRAKSRVFAVVVIWSHSLTVAFHLFLPQNCHYGNSPTDTLPRLTTPLHFAAVEGGPPDEQIVYWAVEKVHGACRHASISVHCEFHDLSLFKVL
jgi:hypothetical protein